MSRCQKATVPSVFNCTSPWRGASNNKVRYSRKMVLQFIAEYKSYSFILHFFVFVFVLPHVLVIVFVFPVFTMTSMHFPKLRHSPTQNLQLVKLKTTKCGRGQFSLCTKDPVRLAVIVDPHPHLAVSLWWIFWCAFNLRIWLHVFWNGFYTRNKRIGLGGKVGLL